MADAGAGVVTPPAGPRARVPSRLTPGPNFPEVVAEVDGEMARHILWYPTLAILRPRWDWTKMPRGSTSESGLAQVAAFPGMHIIINAKERWAKVLDPLGAKENQTLMAKVSGTLKSIFNATYTYVPPVEKRGLDDNALATWLYWLWREHQADHLRIVRGRVITLEEIAEAMPEAKIRRKFIDSLSYRKIEGEEAATAVQAQYADSWVEPPQA